ncbi:hypothetical protein [Gymnodinialimonas ulvae]|uniref:hypothetical protein n=1 Tax=Gymnodinialimonas ulvae TaxID=3126504 RepID=UPI00309DA7CE
MSTMNILTATLIILILAAGIALFFGVRAAQADDAPAPIFLSPSNDHLHPTHHLLDDTPF